LIEDQLRRAYKDDGTENTHPTLRVANAL